MKTKAEIKRKYRLKKTITEILKNHLKESYFLTLTFNEEFLKSTTKKERLKIIESFLNNQTDKYILNCDYGKENKREHYHALVVAKDKYINFTLYNSKYGNINSISMNKYKNQSIESKTNYLLTHALKETSTKKIIYSRSKRINHKSKNKKYYLNQNYEKTEPPTNKIQLHNFINDYLKDIY